MGLVARKPVFRGVANNTGANQSAHPPSLISAFVIRFLESSYVNLLWVKFHFFWIVSVAEETGLKLALSETPKTGFVPSKPIYKWIYLGFEHASVTDRRDFFTKKI